MILFSPYWRRSPIFRACSMPSLLVIIAQAGSGNRQLGFHAALQPIGLNISYLGIDGTGALTPLLGRGALLDHPLLEKWRRDSAGFEVMEGTASIQKLNIAEGQLRAFPGGSP